jgi:predicted nucleic acid-binding protein
MRIGDALQGVRRLGIDTAPVIYFVEGHPKYNALVADIFQRVSSRSLGAYTSLVTLAEVLVLPLRNGDTALEQQYRSLLFTPSGIQTRQIGRPATNRAADLRARYRLDLPDAFQIAVALGARCQAFLTNDVRLKRVTHLRILVLDELEL